MHTVQMSDEDLAYIRRTWARVRDFGVVRTFIDDQLAGEIAVVQIDAGHRPDVADLLRIVRFDGINARQNPPIRYIPTRGEEGLLITATVTDPATCEFTFLLGWRDNPDFFEVIAVQGFFVMTVGELDAPLGDDVLRVNINAPELRQVLAGWQVQR